MLWAYFISIGVCLAALSWAVYLAFRARDRRFVILAGLVALILTRITLDVLQREWSWPLDSPWRTAATIAVSVLALLAVAAVYRLFASEQAAAAQRRSIEAELRASRARFSGILDIAEDGIITVNARQEIVLYNRGAEKIFGNSARDILGQPLTLLIPQRFAADHAKHVEEFARGDLTSRRMGERAEVYGLRQDGTEFPADISISKLQVDGAWYFTAIVRDATERRRYEAEILRWTQELEKRVESRTAELAETNRQLARKSEENETFVYSVSHDLRSPLVNLQGFSQELRAVEGELRKLLAHGAVPVEVREKADDLIQRDMAESISFIEKAVARLSAIIDALLRLSRVGRVEYREQVVDLQPLVERVVAALQSTIEQKGAEVVIQRLPPAWGDPVALEQVFANLIGNALHYLAPGRPGRVEIGCRADAGLTGAGLHTYYVRDNGRGIPQAYAAQLFQAFRRLHPDAGPGEGMGLAIVRRIVERHGGTVWAESAEGEGSTFLVTLPAATGRTQAEPSNGHETPHHPAR